MVQTAWKIETVGKVKPLRGLVLGEFRSLKDLKYNPKYFRDDAGFFQTVLKCKSVILPLSEITIGAIFLLSLKRKYWIIEFGDIVGNAVLFNQQEIDARIARKIFIKRKVGK